MEFLDSQQVKSIDFTPILLSLALPDSYFLSNKLKYTYVHLCALNPIIYDVLGYQ